MDYFCSYDFRLHSKSFVSLAVIEWSIQYFIPKLLDLIGSTFLSTNTLSSTSIEQSAACSCLVAVEMDAYKPLEALDLILMIIQ